MKFVREEILEIENNLVMVSGGFDPVHSGHVRMILEASTWGDVIVVLNSDEWLKRKKGYVFMTWEERAEIIRAFKGVVDVVEVDDRDNSVTEAVRRIIPRYFANGGDRGNVNTPEVSACEALGVNLLWNVGGKKTQSSSLLVEQMKKNK